MDDFSKQYAMKILTDNNVDINDVNYKKSDSYQQVKFEWIFSDTYDAMTLDEYIERFLLSEESVRMTYESIYDMGNTVELFEEDCSLPVLAEEIIDNLGRAEGMDGADRAELIQALCFNLTRKKVGLVDKLKSSFGISFESSDTMTAKHQAEIYKILYFFYMLENRSYPEINVLPLLSKHSMEHADHSIHEHMTANGGIVLDITNSLAKEISLDVKANMRKELLRIVSEWETFIAKASMAIYKESDYDFSGILSILGQIPSEVVKNKKISGYQHSPIETLYLHMLQYEYLGHLHDIMLSNTIKEENVDADYELPTDMVESLKKTIHNPVSIGDIADYLKKNVLIIDKYVYPQKATNERKYLREIIHEKTSKDAVRFEQMLGELIELLSYLKLHKKPFFDSDGRFSELLLISCMQAIHDRSSVEYKFFRSQITRTSQKKDKKIKVQSELGNACSYYGVQAIWVRKVIDRLNANLGLSKARMEIRELEIICDNTLVELFRITNINDMVATHEYYIGKVNEVMDMLLTAYAYQRDLLLLFDSREARK